MASAPSAWSSAASSCPSFSRRPDRTTFAPSCAKAIAAARPMPVRAPVTSAIFPSGFIGIVFLLFLISLFADPVAYVGRTVEQCDPLCFAPPQEANCLDVDQVKFLQIQHDLRFALPYLLLQLG